MFPFINDTLGEPPVSYLLPGFSSCLPHSPSFGLGRKLIGPPCPPPSLKPGPAGLDVWRKDRRPLVDVSDPGTQLPKLAPKVSPYCFMGLEMSQNSYFFLVKCVSYIPTRTSLNLRKWVQRWGYPYRKAPCNTSKLLAGQRSWWNYHPHLRYLIPFATTLILSR